MSNRRTETGVALLFVAFVILMRAFADEDAEVPPVALRRMKDEARHWASIPSLRLQVTRVGLAAATAELPNGVVTWRTLFGIAYGWTTIDENQSETQWRWNRLLLAIAAMLILELALLAGGVWLIWPTV